MRAADAELLTFICGNLSHPLARRCAAAMAASPRFTSFLAQYRAKICKKLRGAHADEGWRDLWLELWMAARLLKDRRFSVAYELYVAQNVRGPDLTVTYRTHSAFHVEIKRVRVDLGLDKWADVLADKLGQLPAGAVNLLLIGTDAGHPEDGSIAVALGAVAQVAQQGEAAFHQRFGLKGARELLHQVPRLSAILWVSDWDDTTRAERALWSNPQARHKLPPELARALVT